MCGIERERADSGECGIFCDRRGIEGGNRVLPAAHVCHLGADGGE